MRKFSWAVTAFGFERQGTSYKLQVEEAEDKLSEGAELIKQARHSGVDGLNLEDFDEIVIDIATALDKIRRVRNNLKRF